MKGQGDIVEPVIRDVRHISDGVELDMVLPKDLMFFQGHFPGRAILPGVIQIDWAIKFADRYLSTGIASARDIRVKFSSIIEPEQPITLVLRRSADKRRLGFELRDDQSILSSGSIGLEADQ